MRLAGALLLSAFLAAPAAAEVTVRVVPATDAAASSVELTARAAPLAEVLDRLGRQIGMKVVYEGASPRQLVTLSLQGRSATETVLGLLEGQGLNFALVSDPTGTRVVTLLVAGTAPSTGSATPASASGRSTPSTPFRRPLSPPPGSGPDAVEEDEPEEDEVFDDPAPAEGPEAGPADPAGANPVPMPQGPGGSRSLPASRSRSPPSRRRRRLTPRSPSRRFPRAFPADRAGPQHRRHPSRSPKPRPSRRPVRGA